VDLLARPISILAGALRCSLGADRAAIGRGLIAGQGAPASITLEDFPGREFPYFPMKGLDANGGVDEEARLLNALASCVEEALAEAGLDEAQRAHTGLFLGSSSFAVGAAEQQYRQSLAMGEGAVALPHHHYGDMTRHLCNQFGLAAGEYTFSTACTSSANALLYAAQAVRAGQMKAALVVGVECFNRTTLLGFDSLQLLSRSGYRPFDRERSGLVLGEGIGAVVVVDREELPLSCEWEGVDFIGGANGCDPEGITCSSAGSMARVMAQALAESRTEASQLVLIKAHGTGSESNDAAEAKAMQQLFRHGLPPLTTLKGALGHTLGASGVLELVALITCLKAGMVPPTSGFSETDPALGCRPLTKAAAFSPGRVMLNYFGFGGNNTSLVLEVG
jgi:3-oxoacyl-[acyl-carrier-protein] synthase-1